MSDLSGLIYKLEFLEGKIDDLIERVSALQTDLENRIQDERFDRERADDSIKSDLSSLQHKIDYR